MQNILKTIFILFLIFFGFFAFAQFQLEYPDLPGAPAPRPGLGISDFLRYLYQGSLIIGTILALGFLIFGAFLYLISLGNPFLKNLAKSRIFSALLGLLILFSSYVILSNIDPQLVIWDIRVFPIDIPLTEPIRVPTVEPEPPCQEIPIQKTFKEIHEKEKEAIRLSNKIEPLLEEIFEKANEVKEKSKECSCHQFESICLIIGSARCPSVCEPGKEPCPFELKSILLPELDNRLTRVKDLILLLESYNFDITQELEEKIRKKIEEGLDENPLSFRDFIEFFINFLEKELGDLGRGDPDLRKQREKEISEILIKSLPVLVGILDNITRKLTELRIDFEKHKEEINQRRTEKKKGLREILICSLAKTRGHLKECEELNFYHCR
jgi:hypothetical protein